MRWSERRTAVRSTFEGDFHTSTPSDARSRPPSLILCLVRPMKFLTQLLCILGLTSAANAGDAPLHDGDCWSYRTRPGEEQSFLVIRKIEQLPKIGEVVHISIFGLHIKNPHIAGGFSSELPHMPISADSLRRSLTQKLQRHAPDCDWQSGYNTWRDAKAGAFTEPVSECVKFTEDALNHGKPQA
jgi:hypothetical protein